MRLMAKIRENIINGTFVDFVKEFMVGLYPEKNYPKWSFDALESVGIKLL